MRLLKLIYSGLLIVFFFAAPAYCVDVTFENPGGHFSLTYPSFSGSMASSVSPKVSFGAGGHGSIFGTGIFQLRGSVDLQCYSTGFSGSTDEYQWLLSGQFLPTVYLGPFFLGVGAGFGGWVFNNSSTQKLIPLAVAAAGFAFGSHRNYFVEGRAMVDASSATPFEGVYSTASAGISF
jgi:hypothetical protein